MSEEKNSYIVMLLPRLVYWLCDFVMFRLLGWTVEGSPPDVPKYIAIGAPHTSNWDFLLGMAAYKRIGMKYRWYGKHTIFRWPFGSLLRAMGGFPIERSQSHDVVAVAIEKFQREDAFILAIAPEGTRSKVDRWKTGFYHIAIGAGVPICPFALDFSTKRLVCGELYYPTGDKEADIKSLQDFYRQFKGRHPEKGFPLPD